jgi:hypothetical protein
MNLIAVQLLIIWSLLSVLVNFLLPCPVKRDIFVLQVPPISFIDVFCADIAKKTKQGNMCEY